MMLIISSVPMGLCQMILSSIFPEVETSGNKMNRPDGTDKAQV